MDGFDKLKQYGFSIHGALDGFSRRVLWLEVCVSNNDPAIIAGYYVSCVEQLKGCPKNLRSDPGTEKTALQRRCKLHLREIHQVISLCP